MRQAQILYYDDDEIQLDYWRDVLYDAGFLVEAVLARPEKMEALVERLQKEWWHIIVADISLVENDPSNEMGLHLMRQIDPIIPKILLTVYPDWKRANIAKPVLGTHLPPAIEFIHKLERDSEKKLVDTAADILGKYEPYRINNNLVIHSEEGSFSILASKMNRAGKSRPKAGDEMADLYRKLFFEKEEIFVEEPVYELGQTLFTPVKYYVAEHLPPRTVLVQCGPRQKMKSAETGYRLIQEYDRSQYPSYLQGQIKETLHFAGLIYQLDFNAAHFIPFKNLVFASDLGSLQDIVHRLFTQVCPAIALDSEKPKATAEYFEGYNENQKRQLVSQVERRLRNHLMAAQTAKPALFRFRVRQINAGSRRIDHDEFLPSPGVLFDRPELLWPDGEVPVGPVYGQLQADTLLISQDDHRIWLPAAPLSGHDYYLQDYVTFEASLMLKVMSQPAESWVMFHALTAWLSPTRFEEEIPIPHWLNREAPKLFIALTIITEMRQLAGMAYAPDMRSYYGGLFLEALALIQQAEQSINLRVSPLPEQVCDWTAVAMALIARRLIDWNECETEEVKDDGDPVVRGEIELDEINQRAWLPDRRDWVELPESLFLLLKLLDGYRYGVTTYQVLEETLGHNRRNIHQQISRLRTNLEPSNEGSKSKYITVKWGLGYLYRPDGSIQK